MGRDKKSNDPTKMFDGLVRNALAFLERSVDELEHSPSYAVIDFCTAIELFLKARLLLEHWALVYEDPKRANQEKFHEGDFKSVGMSDAIARLKDISGQRVADTPKKVFEEIRQHRNRLVHFFHPAYGPNPDAAAVGNVTAELCRGWFYLHRLLSSTWQSHFTPYIEDIDRINGKMLENRSFLQVKYQARLNDIEKGKAKGTVFVACWFCGFEAMRARSIAGPILLAECEVCESHLQFVVIKCPNCGAQVPVQAPRGEPHCPLCFRSITLNDVLDHRAPNLNQRPSVTAANHALCSDISCAEDSSQESVILFGDNWVCLHCFAVKCDAWKCESCGQVTAGQRQGPHCIACANAEDELAWPSTSGGVM